MCLASSEHVTTLFSSYRDEREVEGGGGERERESTVTERHASITNYVHTKINMHFLVK